MLLISDLLQLNKYPGRGIVIGKNEHDDKKCIAIAYFIMGRSENSQNRVFEQTEDGIRTKAFDENKMTDPSLIIYHPVRKIGDFTVVTNGDQTDTICESIATGKTFKNALSTRTFEPDAPNFTPRISGFVDYKNNAYSLSILKSLDGDPISSCRYFYNFQDIKSGCGHFIHTYEKDGNPLPSFVGEPHLVRVSGSLDTFTAEIWDSLNFENKVSLYTSFISLDDGKSESRIINKL